MSFNSLMTHVFKHLPYYPESFYLSNLDTLTFVPWTPSDYNVSTNQTNAQTNNRGRRPRRNTNLNFGRDSEVKRGNRATLGNLRGFTNRVLHARKATSKRVKRALQHSYYSALFEGDENIQVDLEEHDQPYPNNCLPKSIFG
ncbi:hypothetical protein FXO38_34418 [Capsicum annuum]|nr:hypothetical protein FXO38_34418 [Capsicum annuum]